jgi:hypothetical protein
MKKAKAAVQPGAPALEKGLDLLEALALESGGLNQKQLAERVGRSVGEIFCMLARWSAAATSRAIPRPRNIR